MADLLGPSNIAHGGATRRVVLISTYDLGRQPFGLASAAAWLDESSCEIVVRDTSRDALVASDLTGARIVAWFLPMHAAVRLAVPQIRRVKAWAPHATLCAFGLYAPTCERTLRAAGVQVVLGPESEPELAALVRSSESRTDEATGSGVEAIGAHAPGAGGGTPRRSALPRWPFRVPRRQGLPPLSRYARLRLGDDSRVVAYTEASRGCKHLCRHCPIVPVYDGRFRVVPIDIVRADIEQQVEAGAQHVTFGDPDFFNGIKHALAIADMMRSEWPRISFDVTIKIQHLRQHAAHLDALASAGCVLVTSAVESFDDEVVGRLRKNHTRDDVRAALLACRDAGLACAPTFVAFTPWTTVGGYLSFLDHIVELDLVFSVAPVQLALRLLVPEGAALLDDPDVQALVGAFDPERAMYPWVHPDPRVDDLQREVAELVELGARRPRLDVFADVYASAARAAGRAVRLEPRIARASIPYLDEPWYC
jgi:hypothetical protein